MTHLARPQHPVSLKGIGEVVTCPNCRSGVFAHEVMTVQICTPSPDPRVVIEGVMCNGCDQPIFLKEYGPGAESAVG